MMAEVARGARQDGSEVACPLVQPPRRLRRLATPHRNPITRTQACRNCIVLDVDSLVWFDRRYLPRPGDIALVINHEVQPLMAPVSNHVRDFKPGKFWIEHSSRPMRSWEHMVLIGVVTMPAGRPKRLAA